MPMTPGAFIAKWRAADLKEIFAVQEHFIDLCRLLDEPTPAEADPTGDWYGFERGARKDSGAGGWADVWKRHHFSRRGLRLAGRHFRRRCAQCDAGAQPAHLRIIRAPIPRRSITDNLPRR